MLYMHSLQHIFKCFYKQQKFDSFANISVLTFIQFIHHVIFSVSMCAPVMVELEGETDPLQIAMKELK